ncbi:MAG: lipid-binding protein [Flavisolibacter sp.]
MKKITIIISVLTLGFVSCKKDLPDVGGTAAQKVANEWWVELKDSTGADLYNLGHFKISTYNTAANNNEIWVDDLKNAWSFKVKAQVDYSNLTFKASAQDNEYYPIKVNITNGKVLPNAGHSKTGNVADSLYMKVEFSDDPGNIYTISGTARTKFAEDEY